MKKKEKGKRIMALLLSVGLVFNNMPLSGLIYAADIEKDISWSQEALDAAIVEGYIPTGLSYRTSTSGIKLKYNFMGEKQYLHGSSSEFSDFENRYIYCVNMHEANGGTLLWDSQAFRSHIYNINDLPTDYIQNVPEEQKKFNFLMMVYAAGYQSKQDEKSLTTADANVGVDILTVCVQIVQEAADNAVFTGDWGADFNWFKNEAYVRALDAVGPTNTLGDSTTYRQLTSTDIPQWAKDKGCKDRAQAIFCYVWTASKLSGHLQIENNQDTWRFEAVLEEDGLYHVRIPFDGDNQFILDYLRTIQAECYGDWQKQEDTSCIHFVSPSGMIPAEGSIARLTGEDGEGMIARNLSEAELYEFKFYSKNIYGIESFDNVQTYFSSVMDKPLEIYLRLGNAPSGGSFDIEVDRFEHEESWNADYNVKLIKYDSETGKPLEGAHFDILEAFDDSRLNHTDLDETDADGSDLSLGSLNSTSWGDDDISTNYSGDTGLIETSALTYNWGNDKGSQFERWDDPEKDPCRQDDNLTDANGRLTYRNGAGQSSGKPAHFDTKSYVYHKGYCNGHPAPILVYEEPPEEEEGGAEGDDDGEDVEAYNQQLHDEAWAAWYAEVETCGELAGEGGFFHAIDADVAKVAMEADRDQFYEDFISLTYEYSAKEIASRKGYILHDLHGDDIPIEWRTVTSSQYKDFTKNGIQYLSGNSRTGSPVSKIGQTANTEQRKETGKDFPSDTPFQPEDIHFEDRSFRFEDEGSHQENPVKSLKPERLMEPLMIQSKEVLSSNFQFIDEDGYHSPEEEEPEEEKATPSEALKPPVPQKATSSEAPEAIPATPAEAIPRRISFTGFMASLRESGNKPSSSWFSSLATRVGGVRDSISFLSSEASMIDQGTDDIIDWTFILYDHRTEGEVHINKQDLDLNQGITDLYNSYGDTQGDGTLEGAVYGLFAATDITHPDGNTGVVFQKDNLIAIATTDKNGDASFPAITEAPGTVFNYQSGEAEHTGFTGPGNLCTVQGKADAIKDNENFEGHSAGGRSLSLSDSRTGDGTFYLKLSSNQGVDGTGDGVAGYPVQNNEENNGNGWIGRPLLISPEGSHYYVMELSRSEGYELSRYGIDAEVTNREADASGALPSAEGTVTLADLEMNRKGGYNGFTATSRGAVNGYDVVVSGLKDGASFYTTKTETITDPSGTHTELVPIKEPVYGTPGSQIILGGKAVEASVGDTVSLPNGSTAVVLKTSAAKELRLGVRPQNAFQVTPPDIKGENLPPVEADVIKKVNEGLKKAGYKAAEEGTPWVSVPLYGTTEEAWCRSLTVAVRELSVFNAITLEEIYQEGGKTYGLLRYTYLQAGTSLPSLYDAAHNSIWVKKPISYERNGTTIKGYLYHEYPSGEYEDIVTNPTGFVTAATVRQQTLTKTTAVWREDLSNITLKDEVSASYWVYADKEQAYDNQGNPVYNTRYEQVEVAPGYRETVTDTLLAATYDAASLTYTVHVEPGRIPADGILDMKIKYGTEFIENTNQPYTEYVQANALLSAFPTTSNHDSYIQNVLLTYPGQKTIYQDAGTREHPIQVFERPIRQKIKIVKDILTTPEGTYDHNTNAESGHEDGFTTGPGGTADAATKLDNFRFKIYQKSNLERLYRDEAGGITWLDRDGKTVDVTEYKTRYPKKEPFGSAQKLYTKVLHKTDSKTTGSINNNVWESAVTANKALYSYDGGGLIQDVQNAGYTRLLETTRGIMEDGAGKTREVEHYNYEKFFDAIRTANHDKWDRKEDGSTSFKPVAFIRALIFGTGGGEKADPAVHNNEETDNKINTSDMAKDNSLRSDAVRQFAITWYLDEEVKKLQEDNGAGESQPVHGSVGYQEEIYDKALSEAIKKTENYLTPFFAYDLDEIYSIAWDSEAEGGSDKDATTLSADTFYQTTGNGGETAKDGYFYGVSKYLPYGAYVTVEQQPHDKELGDFYNKHYKTDQPKEIMLPAVYEPGGNAGAPEVLNETYEYKSTDTPEVLQQKYHIRFNEEWAENHTDDLRKYVIRAHNADGDFEIYKYGLDPDKLTGTITYTGSSYDYKGFHIAQEEFDPYKDIYEAEHTESDYRSNQTVEKYYHYGSVSEDAKTSDHVLYQHGTDKDDNNPSGMYFKDGVKTMTGALSAYDGLYAAALVPWTVTEPADAGTYDAGNFNGYADGKYRNTFYSSRLRIEKLDSETGENILHDGAVFTLYSASRGDTETSDGRVEFYKQDTVISGSKEFLEAMGARDITPVARPSLPWEVPYNGKYYGTVSVGTPVCLETGQIIMQDALGAKTGEFQAFTTNRDGQLLNENGTGSIFADQNVGYLATPQPLGAGCYVLAEIKSPAGYVKSRPVAVEIYSDEVSYYLDGKKDNRVIAAIYEDQVIRTDDQGNEILNPDGTKPNGNKPQDKGDTARIFLNNTPIRLEVSKIKSAETTVSYELNGRLEGSITELKARYGLENLELAYNASGAYLGYGWKKGFLDSLKKKQTAGENIKLLYEDGVFTGKALLYKTPETADDTNRYLPGAVMTLYDAVEIKPNGDREDYAYDGVHVERDKYGNVSRMYVQKGYAGTRILYVRDKTGPNGAGEEDYKQYTYDQQEDDKGAGVWAYKTVEREDTDILFYDLGGLDVLKEEKGILYGHDRNGTKIQVKNGEPVFALKNGTAFLEIVCGDYENLMYSSKDKVFSRVPAGTEFYHLDSDTGRDSQLDPYTGMAFVTTDDTKKILTWPVKISSDQYGNIIAREKIKTSRIATIESDTENEYTIGTYDSQTNRLKKSVNPILNKHGQPVYYQRSAEAYRKGSPVYDRDGDYVRYKYNDNLKDLNDNAYQVNKNEDLNNIGRNPETEDDDKPLYHRQGEAYLIENTWTTGEKTPNDPFTTEMTSGQADVLKRVPSGTYIMEEITPPEGYVKTMPVGVTVSDSTTVQTARATDHTINTYFEKEDAPSDFRVKVIDKDGVFDTKQTAVEGKGSYTYKSIAGAELALFRARQVKTEDILNYPSGYYLEKTENTPASWTVLDNQNQKVTYTAKWTTKELPHYMETVPKGFYILEELTAPSGYVRASMEIEVKETGGLQRYHLPNDHTKIEIFKYTEEETGKKEVLGNENPAGLAVYEAVTDANGIVMENGLPKFDKSKLMDVWTTDDCKEYADFIREYEKLFYEYGENFEAVSWKIEGQTAEKDKERTAARLTSESTDKQESVTQIWITDSGSQISVSASKNLTADGTAGYVFDYRFNYKELNTVAYPNAVSYDTTSGTHRMDYLPLNGTDRDGNKKGYYVLVETKVPEGFAAVDPKPIIADETADIQLYALKNEPKYIYISKVSEDGKGLKGAELALYKAAADGSLIMDASHLFAAWTSGEEGSYTTEDFYNGTIPPGFSAGDLKPHRLNKVPYGTYYLAELTAPQGYIKMEPKKLEITAGSPLVVTAVNRVKQGILSIRKVDTEDSDKVLPGAKFEIKNRDTDEVFHLITDEKGEAESQPLTIGSIGKNGVFTPYRFSIREVMPPDTYELNLTVHHFRFTDDGAGVTLEYSYELGDRPTELFISKSNFDSNEFIKGARLAVFNTKVTEGKYESDGAPLEEWISDGKKHRIKGKLSAGRTYMLKELEAPGGYTLSDPVLFTVSDDGRRVVNVTNNLKIIKFQTSGSFIDAVESVTVLGRQAVETEVVLTDLDTGTVLKIPSYQNRPLTAEDGLTDGHLYEQKELTYYTDGNYLVSGRSVFRMAFDEKGEYTATARLTDKTKIKLETADGAPVEEWKVENLNNSGYAHTIANPEYEDGQSVKVISENGRYGAGVMPGSVVKYQITYKNTSLKEKTIRIVAALDPQLEYMPAASSGGGLEFNNTVYWTIRKVQPGDSGSVTITTAIKEDAESKLENQIAIGDTPYKVMNPVGKTGGLSIVNHVSGTAETQIGNRPFTYRIHLEDEAGQPLPGKFPYAGSSEGTLKSGDSMVLRGNEFITITGLAWGTSYRVEQELPEDLKDLENLQSSSDGTEGRTGETGVTALFLNRMNDSSVREIFRKNETYHLTETTCYTDGSESVSDRMSFTLDEHASVGEIDMKDKPTHVILSKADITGGKELPGARLIIKNEAGEIVEEWISTDTPHELTAVLEPGKTYTLTEVYPPDGYAYAQTIPFTVSEDGTVDKVQMKDKETRVDISKFEITGQQELVGAKLEICDAHGNVIERWISDGTPHVMTGKLKAGETYTLMETAAPDGYLIAEPVTFTVSTDGTIGKVEMRDEPTRIFIEKRGYAPSADGETDLGQLDGAHIKIEDRNKNTVYQFITKGGENHEITGILTAGETYTAVETEAPYGYDLAAPVTFTMPESGEVVTIVMMDRKTPETPPDPGKPDIPKITLKKYDGVTFEGLKGAEFTIYRSDGSVYTIVSTGNDGRVTITRPKAGTYTFKETKAPEGYLLSDTVHTFTVTAGGTVLGNLNVPNQRTPEVPLIKKDTHTGERLAGAIFEVYDSAGKLCERGTTDASGVWNWKPLQAGTYTVVERSAPEGYHLNLAPGIFTVSPIGEISGQTIINNEKEEKKIGRITATYGSNLNGRGYAKTSEQGRWFRGLPKAGEVYGTVSGIVVFILVLSIGILLWRKKKHEKDKA